MQFRYMFFFERGQVSPTASEFPELPEENRGVRMLAEIAAGWKVSPGPMVVVGHVDEVELRTAPGLDLARAQAVRDALVALGVDPVSVTVQADGFNTPLAPSPDLEAVNRYAELSAPRAKAKCVPIPNVVE